MNSALSALAVQDLQRVFATRLQTHASMARYTVARLGGPAEALIEVDSLEDLETAVSMAWRNAWPVTILGGGSNVLVSDAGVRGLVIVNRCRAAQYRMVDERPQVWAESGANFGLLARQAAQRGWAGLEWAVGIPGTLGGAVVGNAGAHGSNMAANLRLAEILHCTESPPCTPFREQWTVQQMQYGYRASALKAHPCGVVLAAVLDLTLDSVAEVTARTEEFTAYRKRTQPPGASLGSMFKNPPGGYAGRLIEAAGLKGTTIGGAQISPLHANFFINLGHASAADYGALLRLAQNAVRSQFGVELEPEIVLIGEWEDG
jgi:UDP-N-acetylmuramate dehydrogenase